MNKNMFSITYQQKGDQVEVKGFNPIHPSDIYNNTLSFNNEGQAKMYCTLITLLEDAVRMNYPGEYAVAVDNDRVDITTDKTIDPEQQEEIENKINRVLDVMPIAKTIQFHSIA
jgi:hypothetical protein